MGCAQSRIENEEAVARCKERRQWMRSAVSARSAFAAAHSAYAVALKNTGASLSEFAHHHHDHHRDHDDHAHSPPHPPTQPPQTPAGAVAPPPNPNPPSASSAAAMDSLPPPPPPLPDFSPSPKIHRSISMPPPPPSPAPILERDDEEEEEEEEEERDEVPQIRPKERRRLRDRRPDPAPAPEKTATPPPPPPPMPESRGMDTWDYFFAMDDSMAAAAVAADDEIRPERDPEHDDEKFATPPRPPPPPPPNADDDSSEPRTPEKPPAAAPLDPIPPLPPKPPGRNQKQSQKPGGAVQVHRHHHQHTASAPPFDGATRGQKASAAEAERSVNLLQVFTDLDDHFLKASESTHEVSKKLEATRMHYHSNFVDGRGHIDHSARVMKVITWNRSFKGMSNADDGKDDFDNDEGETHATVLDKMLAWEKKLYEEVKTGELMKIEYQRKVALLNKQKKRGAPTETLERTKAAVSHLHTRYIVDMQSMDSTVSEIQHLRDNQLYPRLVDLVDEEL